MGVWGFSEKRVVLAELKRRISEIAGKYRSVESTAEPTTWLVRLIDMARSRPPHEATDLFHISKQQIQCPQRMSRHMMGK